MRDSKPALIGLFVVGALVIGIGGLLAFGGSRWFGPSNNAVIFFKQSVSGLSAGSPVTFRGVEIGSVERVTLRVDPDDFEVLMPVYIELTPGDVVFANNGESDTAIDIKRLVARGLRAQLETRSFLTGQLAVDLDFRPNTKAHLRGEDPAVPEIPAIRSEVEQLKAAITEFPWRETLESVKRAMTAVESFSVSLEEDLGGIGGTLRETVESTQVLIAESRENIDTLTHSAESTLTAIEQLSETSEQAIQARSEQLAGVLAQTETTIARIDDIARQLRALTHPRSPERDDLRRTLRNLSSTSAALRRFAEEIESHPNALLFGLEEEDAL